jgi:hypothetical protein
MCLCVVICKPSVSLLFPKYLAVFYAENMASLYVIVINIDSIRFYQNFKFPVFFLQNDVLAYRLRETVRSEDGR